MVRRIALKQAGIGLWAMPVQLKGETACHGGPQRRVNPPAGRQAEQLEPLALVDDVHLLKLGLGLREVEDTLDDGDDPDGPLCHRQRKDAAEDGRSQHDKARGVIAQVELVHAEPT